MAAQTDFWGEIAPTVVRTPVAILREQAALLADKTKNQMEATVYTESYRGAFRHLFNLLVPGLNNYTYNLFTIEHGISLYPVSVIGREFRFETEEDFTEWLRGFLSSVETKRIVGNLLAQVAS
jgi:hypothetical protein